MTLNNLLIIAIPSLLIGSLGAWALLKQKHRKAEDELIQTKSQLDSVRAQHEDLKLELRAKEETIGSLRDRLAANEKFAAVTETKLLEAEKQFKEQSNLLEKAQRELTNTFEALAGQALKSNNQAFLELAKKSLDVALEEAKGEISEKTDNLKTIVKPLQDSLLRYEEGMKGLEKNRAEAYGNIKTQISALVDSQQALQKETGNLVSALRRPEVRGRWGELTLKRVVELAGMTPYVDYFEQVSVETDDGKLRPDMIVRLPSGREIVIDSKVATDAYLDAIACDDEANRKRCMIKHSQQFRQHMKDLSTKSYWSQFEKAPEYVVMFIPGESFLSAAVENDPKLIEDGMENSVIIATPTTLIALLRAIAYGWRQEQITQHAQEIATLARELYDRFQPFVEHVNTTGSLLSKSVVAFNKMIMSLERRVLVSVRKFKDLGAGGEKDLPDATPIEQIPMTAQEALKDEGDSDENNKDTHKEL